MANGHGGSRTPANPAPASGPGAMSQRTDGGPGQPVRAMTGGAYGEGQEMDQIQQSAPMSASGASQTQGQRTASQSRAALPTPLFAPTERPEEPVTEGAAIGPGSGPAVLSGGGGGFNELTQQDAAALKPYLPALMQSANMPNAPRSFVRFVQHLRNL